MVKIDFHVHTRYSPDSIINPKELAQKSRQTGIIPAITDHNTIDAHADFREMKLPFIAGEEIRTVEGDLIALYIGDNIPRRTPFLEAIDLIKEQGGISYLPHPFDITRHGVPNPKLAAKVDIIEIFNARCPLQMYNREAENLAKIKKKLASGGSDSHFLFEYGKTYNELKMEVSDLGSPKALLKALKNAHIHGHKAPVFVRGSTLAVKHVKRFFHGMGEFLGRKKQG